MFEQKFNQIERMLSDLILSVGTLKTYFEEEREENHRRFEQIDKRFEQIDKRFEQIDKRFEQIDKRFEQIDGRFDEVLAELSTNRKEHDYFAARLFRMEMETDSLKEQSSKS